MCWKYLILIFFFLHFWIIYEQRKKLCFHTSVCICLSEIEQEITKMKTDKLSKYEYNLLRIIPRSLIFWKYYLERTYSSVEQNRKKEKEWVSGKKSRKKSNLKLNWDNGNWTEGMNEQVMRVINPLKSRSSCW